MLEMIKEYRASPCRTHIKMGFMSCVKVVNGQGGKAVKNLGLGALSSSKRGCYICKKELDLLLCDIIAVMLGAAIGLIASKKLKNSAKDEGMMSECEEKRR
jgi:hypothetical protein